jgi:type IX secretion system PorP/SprF family membrane protein
MKKTLLLLHLVLIAMTIQAQQDPLFTHFWNTQQNFNPATTGFNFRHEAHAIARQQWVGVNGAPNSQLLSYGTKLEKLHGGLGVTYIHDKIGFSEFHIAKVNYAYHLLFKKQHALSFGLSGGINIFKFDPDWIPPTNSSDPSLPGSFTNYGFTPDFGIAYKFKKLRAGFSITQLFDSNNSPNYQEARHYYLNASYDLGNEEKLHVRPQLLIRTDMVKMSADLNVLLQYKKQYQLGFSWRTSDALCFIAGYTLREKFNLSYSYDITINKLSSISRGSHEIHLGFTLKNQRLIPSFHD